MNTKILVGIVIAVLIALGAFFLLTDKASAPENSKMDDGERKTITEGAFAPVTNQLETGSGSFRTLLGLGKNLSCTVSYTSPGTGNEGSYNGTVYVSGQKMRMEFTTTVAGTMMESNIINDGREGYMWGSSPQGMMAIKFATDPSQVEAQKQQQFNLDQNVNYTCKKWNVDESLFAPPADIKFMDMTQMMKQAMPASLDTEAFSNQQCTACAQIQGASARLECITKFQCN